MKILMTGSTGLVGKELAKKLVMEGHDLVVLVRNPEKARLELPFPAEIIKWDGKTDMPPYEVMNGVEAVIHLAGESIASGRWTNKRKKEIYDSRILSTRSLTQAIKNSTSVKTFISASAIGIYGDIGEKFLDETCLPAEDYLARLCVDWEKETQTVADRVRVVNLRIGVVLSRAGGALEKLIPLFSKGLGGVIGSGGQWMSWIHIQDLVNLFHHGLTQEIMIGPYNAVASKPVTNKNFSRVLANSLGRSLFFPVPSLALKIAMGEMSTIVLASQNVSSQKVVDAGFKFTFPQLEGALKDICDPIQNGRRELLAEQWIPRTAKEIFPFFCDERNLETITPEFLNFKVLNKSTNEIEEGTVIAYKLKLHGIPLRWKSKICKWKPDSSFVDDQIEGPYKRWNHTHEFIPMSSGTLMRDRVSYTIPFGRLGDLLLSWKLVGDINKIFSYRREVISKLFSL
jgi:uncharacterized protein